MSCHDPVVDVSMKHFDVNPSFSVRGVLVSFLLSTLVLLKSRETTMKPPLLQVIKLSNYNKKQRPENDGWWIAIPKVHSWGSGEMGQLGFPSLEDAVAVGPLESLGVKLSQGTHNKKMLCLRIYYLSPKKDGWLSVSLLKLPFWGGNSHNSIISPWTIHELVNKHQHSPPSSHLYFRPSAQDLPKDQDGYPYEPTASVIKDVSSFLELWWVFEYWNFGHLHSINLYTLRVYVYVYIVNWSVSCFISEFICWRNSWLVTFFTWWLDWLFPHGSPIVVERFNIRIIPRGV